MVNKELFRGYERGKIRCERAPSKFNFYLRCDLPFIEYVFATRFMISLKRRKRKYLKRK